MNFDPRSVAVNTETGVIIESEALANDGLRLVDQLMAQQAWQVWLDANGELRWSGGERDVPPLVDERHTTLWQRLKLNALSVFVPERVL